MNPNDATQTGAQVVLSDNGEELFVFECPDVASALLLREAILKYTKD